MIVQKNDRMGRWEVNDQGRGFAIDQGTADAAYQDHLRRYAEENRRRVFVADHDPAPAPQLPSLHEFLETLAAYVWDRDGITPIVEQASVLAHRHECAEWKRHGTCEAPCTCECGAVLSMGPTFPEDGRWAWRLPDGSFDPWVVEPDA